MGSLKIALDLLLGPAESGEEVFRLHRKMVAMEQELARLESLHAGNGHGNTNGDGERIAHLRSSILESRAKIQAVV